MGVFRSHFDWHSSVHAHWTLLSSARYLGDAELSQKILGRLNEQMLAQECERLRVLPNFELPYGQAWLLLLFLELEKQRGLSNTVLEFRKETADRIISWLEATEFPEKTFNAYHSWLITYFLLKKARNNDFPKRVQALDRKISLVSEVKDVNDPKDFFSSESLFSILRGNTKPDIDLASELKSIGPVTFQNCHALGKLVSKSWVTPGCSSDAEEQCFRFSQNFLKYPQYWKDDFATVGHWVPQFLWCGIWLSVGEP